MLKDNSHHNSLGDITSNAKGSGARFNTGKTQWGLLPMTAVEGCVKVFEYGAEKYAIGNWEKGMSWRAVYECLQRHMTAWQKGEELDPESGLPHIDHAMCNLIMLSQYRETFPEGDDRVSTILKGLEHVQAQEAKDAQEQSNTSEGQKGWDADCIVQSERTKRED